MKRSGRRGFIGSLFFYKHEKEKRKEDPMG